MAPAPGIAMCQSVVSIKDHEQKEPSAMNVSIIGLDLAKNVFQVHAIDDGGEVIVRRALRRRQMLPFFRKLEPCLIGMEACGTSHYWARELSGPGHRVKLMPPAYVKPYVKRGKTDAGDAEAIATEGWGRGGGRAAALGGNAPPPPAPRYTNFLPRALS